MKTVLCLALLVLPEPQQTPRAASNPEGWELVWSDEFDGKEIDRSKWKYDTGGHGFGNNELQFYTDRAANSYLEGGALVICALPENSRTARTPRRSSRAGPPGRTAASSSGSSCRRAAASGRRSG